MHATVDLTEGRWRLHTIADIIMKPNLPFNPAKPTGTNSDMILCFEHRTGGITLEEEQVAIVGDWYEATLIPEDPVDTVLSKGLIYAKIFPAVEEEEENYQMLTVYQIRYHRNNKAHKKALTVYTGRLYRPDPAKVDDPPTPPVFFGYGADNTGRGLMTFSLAPEYVKGV